MPKFLPFAGRNAIAEMTLGIQFLSPFDQRIGQSTEAIKADFVSEFPKFEPVQSFTFSVGPQPTQQLPFSPGAVAPVVAGFSLSKVKADGSVARSVKAINNALSVHILEYTSWHDIKPQAINYIKRCLKYLPALDRNPIVAVFLRYVDRFTFDGAADQATAAKLFRPDNRYVALRILDRGNQWHSNSGWFEPFLGGVSTLNQLNISSGIFVSASGVIIDHAGFCTLPQPRSSVDELLQGANDPKFTFESILDHQHAANVELLRNLLNSEMLAAIGLKE